MNNYFTPIKNSTLCLNKPILNGLSLFLIGLLFLGLLSCSNTNDSTSSDIDIPPTITISTNQSLEEGRPGTITFTFSEEVNGFVKDDIHFYGDVFSSNDITTENLTLTDNPRKYSLNITPTVAGTLTITIPVDSFSDNSGNSNTIAFSNIFLVSDKNPPIIISIKNELLIEGKPASLSFTFIEEVTNFIPDDVITSGVSADKGSLVAKSSLSYSLEITPKASGNLEIEIPANSFEDFSSNQNIETYTTNFKIHPPSYTLSFKLNGGVYLNSQKATLEVDTGEPIDKTQLEGILSYPPTGPQPDIQAVTRDLFEWQNNQTKYDFSTIVTSDLTLEAVWSNSCGAVETVHPTDKSGLQDYVDKAITASPNTNLNHIDTSAITDMANLFKGKATFNGEIGCWNVSKVNNMAYMFNGSQFFNQDIGNWNVSNVNNMTSMFTGSESFNQDIGKWNVSNVNNMTYMFDNTIAFNQDISTWDVSSVNNMQSMFNGASAFNQNISTWDVSNVTQMSSMFKNTEVFNQDIGTWNVSNVTSMSEMFADSKAFNGDISNWNVSRVTTMNSMFENAKAFNQNIGSWDVSSAIYMRKMFKGTKFFNQNIGSWDVSSVTDMSSMFNEAQVFNQNIGTWDVSRVNDMSSMFKYAYAFNQDLSGWPVGIHVNRTDMFTGSSMASETDKHP